MLRNLFCMFFMRTYKITIRRISIFCFVFLKLDANVEEPHFAHRRPKLLICACFLCWFFFPVNTKYGVTYSVVTVTSIFVVC